MDLGFQYDTLGRVLREQYAEQYDISFAPIPSRFPTHLTCAQTDILIHPSESPLTPQIHFSNHLTPTTNESAPCNPATWGGSIKLGTSDTSSLERALPWQGSQTFRMPAWRTWMSMEH